MNPPVGERLRLWLARLVPRRGKAGPARRPPSGIERRKQERFEIRIPLSVEFPNPEPGVPRGRIESVTSDLSSGGACVVMAPFAVSAGARLTIDGAPDLHAEAEVRWVLVLPDHTRMKVGVAYVTRSGAWPV